MIALMAATALAWTQQETPEGVPVRWAETAIDYRMDVGSAPFPEAIDIIHEGFEEWEEASDSLVRFYGGRPTDEARDEQNGISEVGFLTEWEHPSTTLAVTRVWVNSEGVIAEFDLLLQADPPNGWGDDPLSVDLLSTVRHEVGHALGIGHSEVREAVMHDRIKPGEIRTINDDDIDAVMTIYETDDRKIEDAGSCSHMKFSLIHPLWAAILAFRTRRVNDEVG